MGNGPISPNEQSKKRGQASKAAKKASATSDETEDNPRPKEKGDGRNGGGQNNPASHNGPISPQEQGVVTIGTGSADDSPPPTPHLTASKAKVKGKTTADTDNAALQTKLRFTVELKVRLAKEVKLAFRIESPDAHDTDILERVSLEVYAKDPPNDDPLFRGEFPVPRGGVRIDRIKNPIPLPPDQQKKLDRVVQRKTSASVVAIYTAASNNKVRLSLEDLNKR